MEGLRCRATECCRSVAGSGASKLRLRIAWPRRSESMSRPTWSLRPDADARSLANVRIVETSGKDLRRFDDEQFDLVYAVDSFPYLVQSGTDLVVTHFTEAARVLRPRGSFIILNFSYRGDPEVDRRRRRGPLRSAPAWNCSSTVRNRSGSGTAGRFAPKNANPPRTRSTARAV